jgi:nucleoid-associated protein YgaU
MRGIVEKLVLVVALAIPLVILGVGLRSFSGRVSPAGGTRGNDQTLPSPGPSVGTPTPSTRQYAPLEATPPPTLVPATRTQPEPTAGAQAAPTAATVKPTNVAGQRTYTVRRGDELRDIAAAHGVSMASIMAINDIPDPDNLRVGQVLIIPNPPQ